MRDFVVAELDLEFAVASEGCEITLVTVQGTLRLQREVLLGVQHVVELDVEPPHIKAVAHILILVELRGFQGRLERQIGTPIDIARGEADPKFNAAMIGILVLAERSRGEQQQSQNHKKREFTRFSHVRQISLPIAGMPNPMGDSNREYGNG